MTEDMIDLALTYAREHASRPGKPPPVGEIEAAYLAGFKAGQAKSAAIVESLAARVVAQSELLTRRAEGEALRNGAGTEEVGCAYDFDWIWAMD